MLVCWLSVAASLDVIQALEDDIVYFDKKKVLSECLIYLLAKKELWKYELN